jgi:hypothetical protein
MDMQTPAARHLMLGATCCWRPPAVSGRLERPGISWQKTIGVQRYYFDGNNKRHLYPCAASIVEVVERGSFTAAGRELNLTQPAVTHQVQELERRFKVALYTGRENRGKEQGPKIQFGPPLPPAALSPRAATRPRHRCAFAASGHAAALPSSVMNARRFT